MNGMSKLLGYNVYHKLTVTTYKNLLVLASYILGIKMANFCQLRFLNH